MHIAWAIMIGLIIGVGARLVLPSSHPGSIVSTVLCGVVGSILASFLGVTLGWFQGAWELTGVIASVVGAILLILLYPVSQDLLRRRDR